MPEVNLSLSLCVSLRRSDPTENDSVEGLRPNARGPGLVTFGVCRLFALYILLTYLLGNCLHFMFACGKDGCLCLKN